MNGEHAEIIQGGYTASDGHKLLRLNTVLNMSKEQRHSIHIRMRGSYGSLLQPRSDLLICWRLLAIIFSHDHCFQNLGIVKTIPFPVHLLPPQNLTPFGLLSNSTSPEYCTPLLLGAEQRNAKFNSSSVDTNRHSHLNGQDS